MLMSHTRAMEKRYVTKNCREISMTPRDAHYHLIGGFVKHHT